MAENANSKCPIDSITAVQAMLLHRIKEVGRKTKHHVDSSSGHSNSDK